MLLSKPSYNYYCKYFILLLICFCYLYQLTAAGKITERAKYRLKAASRKLLHRHKIFSPSNFLFEDMEVETSDETIANSFSLGSLGFDNAENRLHPKMIATIQNIQDVYTISNDDEVKRKLEMLPSYIPGKNELLNHILYLWFELKNAEEAIKCFNRFLIAPNVKTELSSFNSLYYETFISTKYDELYEYLEENQIATTMSSITTLNRQNVNKLKQTRRQKISSSSSSSSSSSIQQRHEIPISSSSLQRQQQQIPLSSSSSSSLSTLSSLTHYVNIYENKIRAVTNTYDLLMAAGIQYYKKKYPFQNLESWEKNARKQYFGYTTKLNRYTDKCFSNKAVFLFLEIFEEQVRIGNLLVAEYDDPVLYSNEQMFDILERRGIARFFCK
eukprot:Pgem_evm1s11414